MHWIEGQRPSRCGGAGCDRMLWTQAVDAFLLCPIHTHLLFARPTLLLPLFLLLLLLLLWAAVDCCCCCEILSGAARVLE